jgi:DHA1 family bicyclomycin/chloramphenicol resistance-like MFS transporter
MVSSASFSLAMQNQGGAAGSASALLGLLSYVSGGIVAPLAGIAGNHSAVPMGIIIAAAEAGAVLSYATLIHRKTTT